ncbi:MAG TPA: hypothetical protein VHB46_15100 [Burkholderiales bacterium]|nr:hypothetical protein [Burkholderiales bacterium]
MGTSNIVRLRIAAALLFAFFAGSLAAETPAGQAAPAARKDRVFIKDVEGIWINEAYLSVLSALKSPHAAARKAKPVVIAIRRDGRAYPIVVTDFNTASLQVVLDVEPDGKPGAYRLVVGADDKPTSGSDAKYIRFEGTRNAQGKFDKLRVAEPDFMKGKWADYVPIPGELSPQLNRFVLAGKYSDEQGRPWIFAENGEATWPDRKFNYELSLNDPAAACDYLQSEADASANAGKGAEAARMRFGYRWKDGKLAILPARLAGKKVGCDAKPLAVLTPQ